MDREELEKIYKGKSRANAVRLFCKECMGYAGHRGGNFVGPKEAATLAQGCTAKKCPLFPYRRREIEPVEIDWL